MANGGSSIRMGLYILFMLFLAGTVVVKHVVCHDNMNLDTIIFLSQLLVVKYN